MYKDIKFHKNSVHSFQPSMQIISSIFCITSTFKRNSSYIYDIAKEIKATKNKTVIKK